MSFFTTKDQVFQIPGPAGELEIMTSPAPEDIPPRASVAIICHPHPLQGGTFTNKVVSMLARTLTDLGLRTVRIKFRGVGKSTGVFAEGMGEQEDLRAVMQWVNAIAPEAKLWLSGFSFGAAVSANVAAVTDVEQLVTVAPPVPRFNLLNLPPVICPWVVVQGDKDDVVNPAEVTAWVATRVPPPVYIRMPEAGHFFHGQLMELRRLLTAALEK
jgi:alpha/beta superfamily hydrolase